MNAYDPRTESKDPLDSLPERVGLEKDPVSPLDGFVAVADPLAFIARVLPTRMTARGRFLSRLRERINKPA